MCGNLKKLLLKATFALHSYSNSLHTRTARVFYTPTTKAYDNVINIKATAKSAPQKRSPCHTRGIRTSNGLANVSSSPPVWALVTVSGWRLALNMWNLHK